MKKVVVIPARLHSMRLPKKVLLDLSGKSMIERVYAQSMQAKSIDAVYIATDSQEILQHCQQFTDNIIITDNGHQSGTDRTAEAIINIECDIIVNVQGDEPFIEPSLISKIADTLEKSSTQMSSAMQKIKKNSVLQNPNVVKVVVNSKKHALYFSRSVIPHHRDGWETLTGKHESIPNALRFYKHIGIYGYKKEFLLTFSKMTPSYLERIEKLEQLRVLENGYTIQMIETEHDAFGIDTIDDYHKALERIKNEQ
ncbi:MAG: 3-deoxy-manno-octulosonate cytidylyltransferase [Sulfurovum sp.]|nr:3-deoxy-manno-octulosonate cytidylyltransferase [Sulfurovum sp.]